MTALRAGDASAVFLLALGQTHRQKAMLAYRGISGDRTISSLIGHRNLRNGGATILRAGMHDPAKAGLSKGACVMSGQLVSPMLLLLLADRRQRLAFAWQVKRFYRL